MSRLVALIELLYYCLSSSQKLHLVRNSVTIATVVKCVNICDTDAFKVSLMMQNKGGKQSFDPFMFSLMTEQSQSQVRRYSKVTVTNRNNL